MCIIYPVCSTQWHIMYVIAIAFVNWDSVTYFACGLCLQHKSWLSGAVTYSYVCVSMCTCTLHDMYITVTDLISSLQNGSTAIMWAAYYGRTMVVKVLVQKNADINSQIMVYTLSSCTCTCQAANYPAHACPLSKGILYSYMYNNTCTCVS